MQAAERAEAVGVAGVRLLLPCYCFLAEVLVGAGWGGGAGTV
jgi:hypothetical protein